MTEPHIERFGPDVSADELIEAVDRDGCAIVHEAIPSEQVSRLNSEFDPLIEATPPGTPNHIPMLIDFMGRKTIRIDGLPGKSKTFVEVLQNPRTLAFADHYLLPSCLHYLLSTAQLIEIQPGETVQALHRDDPAWIHPPIQTAATHRDKADTRGNASDTATQLEVVVLYALSNFTAENGGTRIVPGSHRWPYDRKPREHEIIAAEMPAGSALYYLGKTLHGGGPNTTRDVLRRGLFLGFSLGWLRTKENFFLSTPIEAVRGMPKPVQRLLGYETHGGIGVVDVGCPSARLRG